jgi:uncharacterized protein YdiU (UPF0061 family)
MQVAKKLENTNNKTVKKTEKDIYKKFKQLDGSHPYKKTTPDAFVDYPARFRKGAKIRYFNFGLAKEMGLIPKDHPEVVTQELTQNIIETFSIIIINEFDEENNKKFPQDEIKAGKYMATRYLQLQHPDKKGKNSGDGRSVWNGQIKNNGQIWDVSSCGTGATKLSPATSKFKKFFESGDPSISYGCGYAEVDEGMAQALFSEVFHKNQIRTERALAVLEFEKGYAINVRAHKNLLRPSHFFTHLKQNDLESLKSLLDYHIEIQRSLEGWEKCPQGKGKYKYFLKHFAETFGDIAATFENDYVFCWLDWDGDNILMDGSVIDYGSIRQFGLFHSEYRYDDVDRFSTSILEQREKARYIVQCFAQIVDYIETGEKKSINKLKKNKSLTQFDEKFEDVKNRSVLFKIGFSPKECDYLLKNDLKVTKEFRKIFSYFERSKSKKGLVKVADGVSWDAIFCMRDILRELPQMVIARKDKITDEEFISILKSNYATKSDLEITPYRSKMIRSFQSLYWKLVERAAKQNKQPFEKQVLSISMRSSVINKMEWVTGDSISVIVEKILKQKNKMTAGEIYKLIQDFSELQTYKPCEKPKLQKETKGLVKQFFEIVKEHREGL